MLVLLERAIRLVPKTRLPALVEGYVEPPGSCRDEPGGEELLDEVQAFSSESLRGDYHESFAVNSRNWMTMSEGTKRWIDKCNRLLDRCVAQARRGGSDVRESFDLLFGLLRQLDDGRDDIVFFADEAGSWLRG